MGDKLIIPKRDPNERTENTQPIRVSKKALALVNELCTDTNRTQTDIASRLIEWAYDHCEVIDNGYEA